MSSFSKRHGYSSQPKEITIRETAPINLRTFILFTAQDHLGCGWHMLRIILCQVLREVPNNNSTEDPDIREEVEALLTKCEWFKVYDFIEALHAHFVLVDGGHYSFDNAPKFTEQINSFFLEKGISWQLDSGQIVTRGDDAFEDTVKTSATVLQENDTPTAASHLRYTIGALSIRPNANTAGAVAHATSAVECVLGKVTGQVGLTLGRYLDKTPGLLHSALNKGLDKIYGYASDEGARHGKEGTEPAPEEAEFVVATCAAICTYITYAQTCQGEAMTSALVAQEHDFATPKLIAAAGESGAKRFLEFYVM